MCYVLLVIQLLSMNGFFLSIVEFPVCHCVYPCRSLSDSWCYLQTLCVSADFLLSVVDFSRHLLLVSCASVQYIHSG